MPFLSLFYSLFFVVFWVFLWSPLRIGPSDPLPPETMGWPQGGHPGFWGRAVKIEIWGSPGPRGTRSPASVFLRLCPGTRPLQGRGLGPPDPAPPGRGPGEAPPGRRARDPPRGAPDPPPGGSPGTPRAPGTPCRTGGPRGVKKAGGRAPREGDFSPKPL